MKAIPRYIGKHMSINLVAESPSDEVVLTILLQASGTETPNRQRYFRVSGWGNGDHGNTHIDLDPESRPVCDKCRKVILGRGESPER